ncbi:MAG: hypothetical protein GY810_26560 [Aureispira sp.]|nr:hypothetical protein [Aureispira sp.]
MIENVSIWIGVGFAIANFLFVVSFVLPTTIGGVTINRISYGLGKFMEKKVKGISIEFGVLPISSSIDMAGVIALDEDPNHEWKSTDYRGQNFIKQLLIVLSGPVIMIVIGLLLSLGAGLSTAIINIALKRVFLTIVFAEDISTLISFFELYLTAATNPFLAVIGIVVLIQGILSLTNLQMLYNGESKISLALVLLLLLLVVTIGLYSRFIIGGFILECLYVLLGALIAGIIPYILILFLVANLPITVDDFDDVIDSVLPMEE